MRAPVMKFEGLKNDRPAKAALAIVLLAALVALPAAAPSGPGDGTDWPGFGGPADETRYSPLSEINQTNITELGLAWSYDLPPSASVVSAPLAFGGIVYTATGLSVVRAFNGETGALLWEYDPEVGSVAGDALKGAWGIRGLAYADGRLFVGTADGRLIAIDAKSGRPDWSVRTTKAGDGRYITGAPRVFGGRVIIGHGGADFAPVRGYVTAYDTASGKQLWRFYTVPGNPAVDHDETTRMAAKSWTGKWWTFGGGGTVWNAITYDPEFDRIYLGTGNGAPWNRDVRSPGGGDNLFLCSIVAIDAKTGKYIWHYQTVPGEQWDMNSAMDIQLATLPIGGKPRRVILHAPKNGFFYVIDRETGKPISAEPFVKVTWASRVDMATGRPVENPGVRSKTDPIVIWPSGTLGGHNWYPMAFSPKQRLVYIPTTELPGSYSAKTIDPAAWRHAPHSLLNTGYDPKIDFHGAPPSGAKLGALKAWDPVTQTARWSIAQAGPLNGGVLATGGDLVFQGEADGGFVARAADTGRALWRFDAQTGVLAPPITYRVNGRQYVTVIAGFGSSAAGLGPLQEHLGWDYRTQPRRVLTFVLGGTQTLPAAPARTTPAYPVDTGFRDEPGRAKRGALLYSSACLTCHGANAIALGSAPDLRRSDAIVDPAVFADIVGKGALVGLGMPKFDNLSVEEREDLRFFLRSRAQESAGKGR